MALCSQLIPLPQAPNHSQSDLHTNSLITYSINGNNMMTWLLLLSICAR